MHETIIYSRNKSAKCRRCGRGFDWYEKVFVVGKNSYKKYYCPECASEIEV